MIPVTIVTGFLGSGKTTLILNLIQQLPKDYKLALLKNEYGDVAVDSQLASFQAISGVQELLNGCICCNLVGQLSDALEQLSNDVQPDRIVIETSGSAFPATLAMEVNRLSRETSKYVLDGVMSVIDVENWKGYEDTSYTAKIQARYTDLIVLNKWELVDERRLENVEDRILDLDVDPPIPRQKSSKGWVDKDIVFGLDAKLARAVEQTTESGHSHEHNHDHSSEVEVLSITLASKDGNGNVDTDKLAKLLKDPTKDEVYRIKGVLYASTPPQSSDKDISTLTASEGRGRYILNWAFGRWTFTHVPEVSSTTGNSEPELRLTVVTARYESNKWKKQIESSGLIALQDGAEGQLTVEKKS
ncbi:cobW-domain-containing protein [Macroventuria anomochaeta]|uniref:CobW-domain-containing protein n=1 Tax=Macroventuria anomochaeta TaxID=301207 RepID=A0ACB6S8Y1_9PLEO|nr:cobW-domain-containing protein [Macroventuria anomochaeta]KAF2630725.1 cobW-domain-containing protein [Macroventuria anomochaeta]